MECPICLEYIKISCIPSCTHHFCFECINEWCLKNDDPQCPICKISIRELKFDKQFDELNYKLLKINNNSEISDKYINYSNSLKKNKKIYIDFNNSNQHIPIGIVVKNNKGPGVKILKITNNKMAFFSGLEKNDVILYINNLECNSHKQCINILENLRSCNKFACCILLNKFE